MPWANPWAADGWTWRTFFTRWAVDVGVPTGEGRAFLGRLAWVFGLVGYAGLTVFYFIFVDRDDFFKLF